MAESSLIQAIKAILKAATIAFYKNSASLYSSDNPIIVSQVKQPTIFLVHHSIQQHVQSSEQELASQATASTTWPFPLCPLIMKWTSSVGLGAAK